MLIGISGKKNAGKNLIADIIQYALYNKNAEIEVSFDEFLLFGASGRKFVSNWKQVSFADKLKDIVCLLIGCTRAQLENREFKEKDLGEEWRIWKIYVPNNLSGEMIDSGHVFTSEEDAMTFAKDFGYETAEIKAFFLTPRLLLQFIGTECGRQIIHPNIWVNSLFADYIPKERVIFKAGDYQGVCKRCSITFSGAKLQPLCRECCFEAPDVYPNWLITDVRFPNEAKSIKSRQGFLIRVNRPSVETNDSHESEIALDNYEDFDLVIDNSGTIEDLFFVVTDFLISKNLL